MVYIKNSTQFLIELIRQGECDAETFKANQETHYIIGIRIIRSCGFGRRVVQCLSGTQNWCALFQYSRPLLAETVIASDVSRSPERSEGEAILDSTTVIASSLLFFAMTGDFEIPKH